MKVLVHSLDKLVGVHCDSEDETVTFEYEEFPVAKVTPSLEYDIPDHLEGYVSLQFDENIVKLVVDNKVVGVVEFM